MSENSYKKMQEDVEWHNLADVCGFCGKTKGEHGWDSKTNQYYCDITCGIWTPVDIADYNRALRMREEALMLLAKSNKLRGLE